LSEEELASEEAVLPRTGAVPSADGQRFLMMKPEEGSPQRIQVVLNWFEDLKRLVPEFRFRGFIPLPCPEP